MAGILVVVSYILKEFQYVHLVYSVLLYSSIKFLRENRDKIEIYLAFGATRVEACRPIAIQALKLVLIPLTASMR
jgi:ABC-type iron transport system FetAB permease component